MLERENGKLKFMVADQLLKIDALTERSGGKRNALVKGVGVSLVLKQCIIHISTEILKLIDS
jgi:hypothetical protein